MLYITNNLYKLLLYRNHQSLAFAIIEFKQRPFLTCSFSFPLPAATAFQDPNKPKGQDLTKAELEKIQDHALYYLDIKDLSLPDLSHKHKLKDHDHDKEFAHHDEEAFKAFIKSLTSPHENEKSAIEEVIESFVRTTRSPPLDEDDLFTNDPEVRNTGRKILEASHQHFESQSEMENHMMMMLHQAIQQVEMEDSLKGLAPIPIGAERQFKSAASQGSRRQPKANRIAQAPPRKQLSKQPKQPVRKDNRFRTGRN